ncbi:MAG: dipicolinate synthase subunit B [Clostridia bacterium]|nr:dipicolinate synthase subunit B [Clostridia bacterium]HCF65795.1 dipicolinate synthase subunit B [Clostridiales bacterium]HJJ09042.1 dipicolinate synthase subunit B [Clostridiaceae bacterium]
MKIKDKRIGFVLTGSFCTFKHTIPQIKKIVEEGGIVIPIMSRNAYNMDTKFGTAQEFIKEIEEITNKEIIHTIQGAEPIGPKGLTDILIIAPATGNTIGKLANGITDDVGTMATKSHLRNNNPVVIAISTNDGLAGSAENIGKLLNRNNYFFVPFRQDNPITKPRSLVFDPKYIIPTLEKALEKEQVQPILI